MTPIAEPVYDMIFGRWRSQILYAGVTLGVFDALPDRDARKRSDVVAEELDLNAAALYRLMRALASLGLLREWNGRAFSLTAQGAILSKDNPHSLRSVALLTEGPEHTAIWGHLPDMIRDGRQDGFVRAFGRPAFEHARRDTRTGACSKTR